MRLVPVVLADDYDAHPSCCFQVDSVRLEPSAPENPRDPHTMPVNNSTSIVAALELDLALDVEVDNPHDTVWRNKVGE